ncbi:OLC1v1003598C1 [Oldenlandia corymbosa var. corymbosa]|uniref:OLC1v1003598C1 n=1 Tax=Oldenlandia corymbosa var. corymbosa TaxID=529605 RepID=A0AAV1DAE0_OLDCO|nr:OLC1v1003598C1 [Oldenlandia corymbosa var. corymbosa]
MPIGVQDPLWKRLWNLKLPNRILLFAWRLCHNSLPTPGNLAIRHLNDDSSCGFCQQSSINNCHIFFDCPFDAQIFRIAGLHDQILRRHRPLCDLWTRTLILDTQFPSTAFLIALLSGIWQTRNSMLFEQTSTSPWSAVLQSSKIVRDFMEQNQNQNSMDRSLRIMLAFQPPPPDVIRVFFYGSINHVAKCTGAGIVIQSSDGQFMRGLYRQFLGVTDSNIGEALAMREALLFCRRLGIANVAIQGDFSLIVLAAMNEIDGPSACTPVLEDVIYICYDLPVANLSWIPSLDNVVAHSLVKYAKKIKMNSSSRSIFQGFQGKQGLPISSKPAGMKNGYHHQTAADKNGEKDEQSGIRRRLSSMSLKIQEESGRSGSAVSDYIMGSFRRSKSMSSMGAQYAGNSIRKWWDLGWAWVLSRKPAFAQDLEMNEHEMAAIGSHHKGSWKHVLFKLKLELGKLLRSDNMNHVGWFVAPSNQLLHHHHRLVFQQQEQGIRYPTHHFNHPIRIRAADTSSINSTTTPHQQIPTSSPSSPSIPGGEQGWVSFAEKVSGEWDGYGADFTNSGEPIQLPESVVPEAFREWDVQVFDWQTQCPTLAPPQPHSHFDFHYRLIALLPTVGCEADAATTYSTLLRHIDTSLAFGYLPATGSYVAVWPVQPQLIELEHCLVDPADVHSRVRVIQVLRVLPDHRGLELEAIKVFSEQWYGPFRNGDQLGGCSIRDSAFASTPALDSSKISGVWQATQRTFAIYHDDPSNNDIKELVDDETGAPQSCSRDGDGVVLLPKRLWCYSSSNQNPKDHRSHVFQVGWLLEDGLAIISTCSFSPNANLKARDLFNTREAANLKVILIS